MGFGDRFSRLKKFGGRVIAATQSGESVKAESEEIVIGQINNIVAYLKDNPKLTTNLVLQDPTPERDSYAVLNYTQTNPELYFCIESELQAYPYSSEVIYEVGLNDLKNFLINNTSVVSSIASALSTSAAVLGLTFGSDPGPDEYEADAWTGL